MSRLAHLQDRFEPLAQSSIEVHGDLQQGTGHGDLDDALEIALRLKLMNVTWAAVNQCLYGCAGPLGKGRG